MALLTESAFETYKRRMVPVLYDWFMHYHLSYPTQTCRWGPKVEDLGYKTKYQAYLSEQVVDETKPNTLILAHIDVFKPHVSSCEAVSNWQEKSMSPYVHIVKTIYHPGEVNKVRELPKHPEIVVTHSDSPRLYVWNLERQPDRRPQTPSLAAAAAAMGKTRKSAAEKAAASAAAASLDPSPADLVLVGHEDDAQFPLACSSAYTRVASGGNDALVLVWDLADHVTGLTAAGEVQAAAGCKKSSPELQARNRLEGHTATVGDLVFQPGSGDVLMSVADDGRIITWDVRQAGGKVAALEDAHGTGVNVMCVDWCPVDEHLVVTGAQDGSLQVWDRRRMSARSDRLFCFDAHRNAAQRDIIHVEWHPTCKNVFASGSEDHTVAVWDLAAGAQGGAADSLTATKQAGPDPAAAVAAAPGGTDAAAAAGTAPAAEADKGPPTRKRARTSAAKDVGGAAGGSKSGGGGPAELPPQLIFRHLGHRLGRVTDFQWLPSEPWTVISVSDNSAVTDDGADGSLQVWRMMDLIYRPQDEAAAELEQHREFILRGAPPGAKDKEKEEEDKEKEKGKASTEADTKQEATA